MDWLFRYLGISNMKTFDVSIPKEKVAKNIRTSFVQSAMTRELGNIEEITYHAIFREDFAGQHKEELHIIEVALAEPKFVKPIAEAFQQAIPYSKVIIFSSREKYLLFHGRQFEKSIAQYDFSDWVYKEEILVDFDLGIERQPATKREQIDLWKLPNEMLDLFYEAASSPYLCLRHLIDILKIREANTGKDYVRSIIAELANSDNIEFFADYPFVLWTEADQQYLKRNPNGSSVEDRRFGIDRQFEPLYEDELTTIPEMLELLNELTDCRIRPEKWDDSDNYDGFSDDD